MGNHLTLGYYSRTSQCAFSAVSCSIQLYTRPFVLTLKQVAPKAGIPERLLIYTLGSIFSLMTSWWACESCSATSSSLEGRVEGPPIPVQSRRRALRRALQLVYIGLIVEHNRVSTQWESLGIGSMADLVT